MSPNPELELPAAAHGGRARNLTGFPPALSEPFGALAAAAGIDVSAEWFGAGQSADSLALRRAWVSLRRADAVAGLYQRLGLSELQAVQGLGGDYAVALPVESAQEAVSLAAQAGMPILLRGAACGAVQRWTGELRQVRVDGPRVTASAPGIVLHWHEDRVASAWLVKTPTSMGLEHSLVLFDSEGGTVLRIDGARRPGRPEDCQWRELLCSLCEERMPCRC